jgi:predicted ATPase
MNVDDEDVDARRFERLLCAGRSALAEKSFGRAASELHEALALWRGHALADVCAGGSLAAQARRLEELRIACVEERIEADLELGRQTVLVAELRGLVQETPLRERLWCQLARALYGCGRQAEALAAVREARTVLDRELGVEPSAELRRVELAVLRQEQGTATPPQHADLPTSTTGLIGRETELAELERLLVGHRLVTITGLGGTGKTRLALEIAHRQRGAWAHGVWWIDLTAVSDPELVVATTARVLGIPDHTGTVAAVRDRVRQQELLLVIDNCEHVIGACAELVDELLRSCPNVTVLATSRVPISVAGERDYALDPLPAPDETATAPELANAPAVRLFVERATAARRDLATDDSSLAVVAHICRELDGLPLAIELAAARAKSLSPAEIASRLDDRFRFLQSRHRVAVPRHRTLTAALDWSYELRKPEERQLLGRLSVFSGGATLGAIAEVCADGEAETTLEPLTRLVDASLVRAEPGDPTRYTMLETVRQYAARRLAAAEDAASVRHAHAAYFTGLAESANLSIDALGHGPQRHEYVLAEQHNIRAALDWSTAADVALAARLVLAMENFWVTHALAEGERRFAQVLAVAAQLPVAVRARLRRDHAGCLDVMDDFASARAEYEQSRKLFLLAGDEVGAAYVDYRIGIVLLRGDGDIEGAHRLWEHSLATFRQQDFPVGELQALGDLGGLEVDYGDRARGRAMIQTSLEMARSVGWSWWAARANARLAAVAAANGDAEEADSRARELLGFARRTGNRQETLRALAILARAAAARGDEHRALGLWSAVIAIDDEPGRFGRFDREEYAAAMPERPLPPPLSLDEAVQLALSS